MQGTGVADNVGALHMLVFRYEITDSVVNVKIQIKDIVPRLSKISENTFKKKESHR
mgnify:CR=1 FL=1